MKISSTLFAGFFALATPAFADAPQIVEVTAHATGMGWNFSVTLEHPDTGWDHFADGWEIVDSAGNVLGFRELHHPHVQEQPFTRSLSNVMLPDGTRTVFIRARCSENGWDKSTFQVDLNR